MTGVRTLAYRFSCSCTAAVWRAGRPYQAAPCWICETRAPPGAAHACERLLCTHTWIPARRKLLR
eukprot:2471747-Prymnesium_polylepis.1